MSAFFLWFEFTDQPVSGVIARGMLDAINEFGGDHRNLLLNNNLAIGIQGRWTTPEDVGEQQPLFTNADHQCLVFDGRIDNRQHLIDEVDAKEDVSDGELLLQFIHRFGESRLAEIIGPFAFAYFDFLKGELIAARDAMGSRYLVYQETEDRLLIASSEVALMRHPDVGHRVRESKIAAWLSSHPDAGVESCLQGLNVLLPGQMLKWRGATRTLIEKPFYRLHPERNFKIKDKSNADQEYANEFRRLLDQAVERRMRSRKKVGSMLSGGMDSVPITISASLYNNDQLQAYSWVFDRSPEMDERQYSEPICKKFGIQQELVVCDDLWPNFDSDTHNNPLYPVAFPYGEFQQQTLRQAAENGIDVMLTGMYGVLLYEAENQQVIAALWEGKLSLAWQELTLARQHGRLSWLTAIKRYLIAPLHSVSKWLTQKRLKQKVTYAGFTEYALGLLKRSPHPFLNESYQARRPLQYRVVTAPMAGDDAMLGKATENKYQIERRYPFRDRDLCEFMLFVPTSQLKRLGVTRPIVKKAYVDEFTQELINRNDKTAFTKSLIGGIENDLKWRSLLKSESSFWQLYVKNCDLSGNAQFDDANLVVLWRCAYYNFWHQHWYGCSSNEGGIQR